MLAQQDKTKKFTGKTISCHGQFEKYIKQYLSVFTIGETEKYDLATNENSKYLLYRFNNWVNSVGTEKIKIRHSPIVKYNVGIREVKKKRHAIFARKNHRCD